MITIIKAEEKSRQVIVTIEVEMSMTRTDSTDAAIESGVKQWARDNGYNEVVRWEPVSKRSIGHTAREEFIDGQMQRLFRYVIGIEVVVNAEK